MAKSSKRFHVSKLIRDQIPEILTNKGIVPHTRIMEQEEFVYALKEKLLEEAQEVQETQSTDELTEELADMLEVIHALAQTSAISVKAIEEKRTHKRRVKGGFDSKIFNQFVDVEETNPAIEYYRPTTGSIPTCLFCKIAKGELQAEIVAHFKHCFAMKDAYPVSPGHILIIPYEHTENWFTARPQVQKSMMEALEYMKKHLDATLAPDGYNIGANCGTVAGQTVMHLHMHLIPRYKGDMQDPKGGVRGVIPSKQKY